MEQARGLSCPAGRAFFTQGVLTQLTICEKDTRKRKFRSMPLGKEAKPTQGLRP